jgi:spore germination protein KC
MHVIIVKGKASDFIEQFNPVLGTSISRTQESMMLHEGETGLFDDVTYNEFLLCMKSTYRQATATYAADNDFSSYILEGPQTQEFKSGAGYYAGEIPRMGGNSFELFGTALFNGDKMVGKLNGDETRAMLMLEGDFHRSSITIQDPLKPELRATIDTFQKRKPKIKISFIDDKPAIEATVFLRGNLINLQSTINYENQKLKPILENRLEVFIKGQLDNTFDKCKKLKCDAFYFGNRASRHFLKIQDWEKYDWNSKFKDAVISTKVEVDIERVGTLMKTNETKRAED